MLLKKEKETQVKFSPGFSANRPSNNWAQIFCGTPSLGSPACSLQSAVCSLQSAVCGLRSAVCSLRSAVCGLRSANVIHRKTESHNRNLTLVSLLQ